MLHRETLPGNQVTPDTPVVARVGDVALLHMLPKTSFQNKRII